MKSNNEIKRYLEKKLISENSFWSFDKASCKNLSDWNLIKYVLIRLDLDDIKYLFKLYPKTKIKQVWLQELVPQGDYLLAMNICFALLFFDAKRPRQYVKTMETIMLKKKLQIDNHVKLSFYAPDKVKPNITPFHYLNNLILADEATIASLKMELLLRRNEFRDYYDLYCILKNKDIGATKQIIMNALKYSEYHLKTKNLIGMLTNADIFKCDAKFAQLAPKYQVTSKEIALFMAERMQEMQ